MGLFLKSQPKNKRLSQTEQNYISTEQKTNFTFTLFLQNLMVKNQVDGPDLVLTLFFRSSWGYGVG